MAAQHALFADSVVWELRAEVRVAMAGHKLRGA
jgi:hypothetical protein